MKNGPRFFYESERTHFMFPEPAFVQIPNQSLIEQLSLPHLPLNLNLFEQQDGPSWTLPGAALFD